MGDLNRYNVALSLFLTHLIYVFMTAKIGTNGVSIVHSVFTVALFFMISPYPCEVATFVLAGGLLGEVLLLFVKKKRTLLPNSIIYFVFYIVYMFRDYVSVKDGFALNIQGEQMQNLGITFGVLVGAYILSYVISRMILMPKLRRAGIEK